MSDDVITLMANGICAWVLKFSVSIYKMLNIELHMLLIKIAHWIPL